MRLFFLAGTALLAAMAIGGAGAQAPDAVQGTAAQNGAAADDPTARLNQETNERVRAQLEARRQAEEQLQRSRENNARIDRDNERRQREYEEQMRARDAAIAAEQARYNAEMERFRAQQAAAARRGGRSGASARAGTARSTPSRPAVQTGIAGTSGRSCADQVRRARGRGRAIGGVVGGVAGIVGGRNLGNVARVGVAALSAPVGALIGDAIASRLDCREQEQAALATEQAVEGGVGTTVTWRSDTRGGVSGTSTVTAIEAVLAPTTPAATPVATSAGTPAATTGPAATASVETSPCLTVTDVIIVDGEETRAAKRMCRRPPSNRFVRV